MQLKSPDTETQGQGSDLLPTAAMWEVTLRQHQAVAEPPPKPNHPTPDSQNILQILQKVLETEGQQTKKPAHPGALSRVWHCRVQTDPKPWIPHQGEAVPPCHGPAEHKGYS